MKATREHMDNLSRLTRQAAFDSLRATKIRWVSKGFALQAIPKTGEKTGYCIISSKKTAKLATDRNRMRRRLRAVALEILPLHAQPNMDYMIIARHEAATRPMDDLRRDMQWCLKKLELLKNNVE